MEMDENAVIAENKSSDVETSRRLQQDRDLFRRVPWSLRDVFVGVGLLLIGWSAYFIPWPWLFNLPQWVIYAAAVLLGTLLLLVFPIAVVRRRVARPMRFFPGWGLLIREFALAIPLTLGVLIAVGILVQLLDWVSGQSTQTPQVWRSVGLHADLLTGYILVIGGVTLGPIAEEVFFRGFLYNAIASRFTRITAACAQAILFAVMHRYEWVPLTVTFFLGLILVGIYRWRKSLAAPIFVHAMYNSLGFAVLLVTIISNNNAPMLGVHATTSNETVCVDQVLPGSAAEEAGIQNGDIIQSYNGRPVTDFQQFIQIVRKSQVGETVHIRILRNGKVEEVQATLRRKSDSR